MEYLLIIAVIAAGIVFAGGKLKDFIQEKGDPAGVATGDGSYYEIKGQ